MKEGDKRLRTFYQTSLGESRVPAGSWELEIQERYSVVGGLEGGYGKMEDTIWREDGGQWWEDGR